MCTKVIPELGNQRCTGVIDYDIGFNNLVCNECGKKYNALDLEKENSDIEIIKGGNVNMKVIIRRGNEIVQRNKGTDSIKRSNKRETTDMGDNTIKVLFKGRERDISTESRDESEGMNTHEDIMKARQEIMDRQKKECTITEEDIKEYSDMVPEGMRDKFKQDEKDEMEPKETQEILSKKFKDGGGWPMGTESNDEEAATIDGNDDLTDIDVLEEKYGYLEDEFEDGTYEKITRDTKKFY